MQRNHADHLLRRHTKYIHMLTSMLHTSFCPHFSLRAKFPRRRQLTSKQVLIVSWQGKERGGKQKEKWFLPPRAAVHYLTEPSFRQSLAWVCRSTGFMEVSTIVIDSWEAEVGSVCGIPLGHPNPQYRRGEGWLEGDWEKGKEEDDGWMGCCAE